MSVSFTGTADDWAAAVVAKVKTQNPAMSAADEAALKEYWKVIAEAHIQFIQDNLLVTTLVSGVTAGGDTASGTSATP